VRGSDDRVDRLPRRCHITLGFVLFVWVDRAVVRYVMSDGNAPGLWGGRAIDWLCLGWTYSRSGRIGTPLTVLGFTAVPTIIMFV
jgi:hypothetical protein